MTQEDAEDMHRLALGGSSAVSAQASEPSVLQDAKPPFAVCDGKEQEGFEAWAKDEKMNMETHPLHWLFLDSKTAAARNGWKAAIRYCRNALAAQAPQAPGGQGLTNEDVEALLDRGLADICDESGILRYYSEDAVLEHIRAALQAEPQAAPQAGWKLVPVEPTLEMCLADWNVSMSDAHSETGTSEAAWRAMLNAAPDAPQATKDAEVWHALVIAEAALADIGDADREPGDDVAWCEARASAALPTVRAVLAARKSQGGAPQQERTPEQLARDLQTNQEIDAMVEKMKGQP